MEALKLFQEYMGTGLIMIVATFLPTLKALRLPEPRVIARLAAE